MKTKILLASGALILLIITGISLNAWQNGSLVENYGDNQVAAAAASVKSPFIYVFSVAGTLYEAGSMSESSSPYWWVNSGAKLILASGTGFTSQGRLEDNDKWRLIYAKANPLDTDNGYHPQNIFRLISRNTWHDFQQQMYYRIDADNLSASPNRSVSNGLLLFNRYRDSQNLYYAGVRVDGTSVIKKKIGGIYYTMAQNKIFPGVYNTVTSPSLLPHGVWIGLRTEVTTTASSTVVIKLYDDVGKTGSWTLIAQATDDGMTMGPIINDTTYVGVRTDFMDVSFDDYRIQNL